MVARLPRHIGQREVDVIARMLGLPQKKLQVLEIAESNGPGNAVMIETQNGIVTELFTGFGQRGVKAEDVARAAAKEAQAYLRAKVPVGPHLADQLLIPLALAGGGAFVTCEPTLHTKTNIEVVQRFLPVRISVHENAAGGWRIEVER
jgi:RNA 3'-terminal phosphate cyclase (ATP)